MSILTKSRLTAISSDKAGLRSITQIVNEAKSENRYSATTTIFLSHSHDDLADGSVNKVIVFLRSLGIRVYIDSHDSSMPPFTSAETARKIKEAINDNKKFIFLATNKAISSKWCNWELGYGDAKKYINGIALFPLSENSGIWEGAEYLRIYPRIEESDYTKDYYKIIYPDGKEVSVADWLKI